MKAGAVELLTKPYRRQESLEIVQRYLKKAVDEFKGTQQRARVKERLAGLALRERTVLMEIAKGLSSKMIAQNLGISPRTVDVHRRQILRKMRARSVVHLVSMTADTIDEA